MTVSEHRVYPNLYKDSVALMAITAAVTKLEGIEEASVVMATEANRANLRRVGLADDSSAGPNDLLVVVRGAEEARTQALDLAEELLTKERSGSEEGAAEEAPPVSLKAAASRYGDSTLALISVPGQYAAAEALKALELGLDVMMFSDNVPVDQEIALKRYADDRGLLVMGPDCGTAIVGGVPLGFANAVRRGSIGIVGASGTGTQEVATRIHHLGAGVSHALGTGGHDLSAEVGAISMLRAMRGLEEDEATDVIVLVSKPPAPSVAARVLDMARSLSTPVVAVFVGPKDAGIDTSGIVMADTLAGAADLAVAVAAGKDPVQIAESSLPVALRAEALTRTPSQKYLRGVFSGGTFCYETQSLCQQGGVVAASNTPVAGNKMATDLWHSEGHTILDMGDDVFTQGRPHPMIDPTLRNERITAELGDPETAVLVFDVVIGYGASADPVSSLIDVLETGRRAAAAAGRTVSLIAHVCGTELDSQDRSAVVERLRDAGVYVADSNAEAAHWALATLNSQTPSGANS
ncbi:acyl-CoA synthetase FdrA [Leucobacter viscericola]|uniref:Acyl-CoA synthetase FdrA n=1 Tax=Leucobacter viscericola TaxID=2714935 RepID=A0A6G7XBY3_9MICO|nr:acyl-CoA synthetase FdrA [Leucobacter viscericola]QIK61959.1 acyl-CoA synthetase FdrA [Leucobacter viscericola]